MLDEISNEYFKIESFACLTIYWFILLAQYLLDKIYYTVL